MIVLAFSISISRASVLKIKERSQSCELVSVKNNSCSLSLDAAELLLGPVLQLLEVKGQLLTQNSKPQQSLLSWVLLKHQTLKHRHHTTLRISWINSGSSKVSATIFTD